MLKRLASLLLLASLLIGFWLFHTMKKGPFGLKRSIPGHLVRVLKGKAMMVQYVDDLCDELSRPEVVASLRVWAATVVPAQSARTIPTETIQDGEIRFAEAPEIAPPPSLQDYGFWFAPKPVTFLHLDADRRVDALILSWANLRMALIIAPGPAPSLDERIYQRQPASDIRVFFLES